MLGWLKRNNSNIDGLTGAEYNLVNPADPTSQKVYVTDQGALVDPDPDHSLAGTAWQLYGQKDLPAGLEHNASAVTMGGFVANEAEENGATWAPHIMDCIHPAEVPVITTLASQFAVFDRFYAGVPGPTYPNRLFAQSASSWGFVDNDLTQTVLGWPQANIYSALDKANASWRVYFHDAATSWLFSYTRSVAALEKHRFFSSFAEDAAKGDLPAFTWIDPAYVSIPGVATAQDQHPSHDVTEGERLIKSVYETLRASPVWNETVLVITYDEHGGFYDHVPTPVTGVPNPDGVACKDCKSSVSSFNFTRLGVRVPTVVVSPWIAAGTVVHEPTPDVASTPTSRYELSSLSATLHSLFGAPLLNARSSWAAPFDWVWESSNLTQPRTDCPATLPTPPAVGPAHIGKSLAQLQGEGMPVSHLQKELLYLVHGVAGTGAPAMPAAAADAGLQAEARRAAVEAALAEAGAFSSEPEAGRHMREVVRKHLQRVGLQTDAE